MAEPVDPIVTLAAMKLLLGRLYALFYAQAKLNPDDVQKANDVLLKKLATTSLVRSSDPAISDVMSDDVLREIEGFLRAAEKDYRAMLKLP